MCPLWSWTWFTLRLVDFHHRMSCVITIHFYVVIFMRLQSYRLCCNWIGKSDRAMTRFHENWLTRMIRLLCAQIHPPIKLTLGTPTLSAPPNLCPWSEQSILQLPPCQQNREMAPEKMKHLRDKNFQGDQGHVLKDDRNKIEYLTGWHWMVHSP